MRQITLELRCYANDGRVDERINSFMEGWGTNNPGHLTVNALHGFEKMYPGDGKTGTWVLVIFDVQPMSDFERELQAETARFERD